MSEREKETLKTLCDKFTSLDEKDQNYILGVTEGMAIVKEREGDSDKSNQ